MLFGTHIRVKASNHKHMLNRVSVMDNRQESLKRFLEKLTGRNFSRNLKTRVNFICFLVTNWCRISMAQSILFTTKDDCVLSNRPTDLSALSPCSQEEADTWMMFHLHHAAEHGHTTAYVRTVDTDVVVLAIYHFNELNSPELWIGFESGRTCREIPIHQIS